MRHKHADLIHAWAEGAEIEYLSPLGRWLGCVDYPCWDESCEYRIKPQKKPDVVRLYKALSSGSINCCGFPSGCGEDNLKLTFDGDTGKLINAEVIERN